MLNLSNEDDIVIVAVKHPSFKVDDFIARCAECDAMVYPSVGVHNELMDKHPGKKITFICNDCVKNKFSSGELDIMKAEIPDCASEMFGVPKSALKVLMIQKMGEDYNDSVAG